MDLLDVRQTAEYLKLNEYTVRRLARGGEIPSSKVGGVWRFRRQLLDSWFDSQSAQQVRAHVLVVDDEEYIRHAMRRVLQAEGMLVTVASSGPEALRCVDQNPPDLVLLDLKMPEMDGPEVLMEIRRREPEIPVLILTGFPDSDLVSQALDHSPITLLTKDAPEAVVVEAVHEHLRNARLGRRNDDARRSRAVGA